MLSLTVVATAAVVVVNNKNEVMTKSTYKCDVL